MTMLNRSWPLESTTGDGSRLAKRNDQEDLARLQLICAQKTEPSSYPHAGHITANLPVYEGDSVLRKTLSAPDDRQQLMNEFHRAILGPGVFVIRHLMDSDLCRRVNALAAALTPGLKTSAHERTPKFTEKHALLDADSFAEFYSNPLLAAVSESWLGPAYQMTAQCNAIGLGADGQNVHRDFPMSHWRKRTGEFPLATHIASQFLTLQCAIALTPQPLSSGPTRFMPYSNQNPTGYLDVTQPEHADWVRPRMSQLPLEVGDAVFFNGATYHQPGENQSPEHRVMCIFQINSCFNRAMETRDTLAMTKAVWPVIRRWAKEIANDQSVGGESISQFVNGSKTQRHPLELDALITATTEGYSYPRNAGVPNNTDNAADTVRLAISEDWSDDRLFKRLGEIHQSHAP